MSMTDLVYRVWVRLPSALGAISHIDAQFLLTIIQDADATRVLEVGVAAGVSSTAILALFAEMGGRRELYSFDILDHFYDDPSKEIGYVAKEAGVATGQRYSTYGGALSGDIGERLRADGVELPLLADVAFIDAHHCQPWAAIDALCVLPHLNATAWIVLHDVNLPKLSGRGVEIGPRVLFDAYKGHKLEDETPPPYGNIGALRFTGAREEIDSVIDALDTPWEVLPELSHLARCLDGMRPALTDGQLRRVEQAFIDRGGYIRA
jgi:predicted O-methyltransferase YrrM